MRALLFSLAGLLAGCATGAPVFLDPFADDPSVIRYVAAHGDTQVKFSLDKMVMYLGLTEKGNRRRWPNGEIPFSVDRIRDCSDDRIVCLGERHFVFAVPRQGIAEGMSYEKEGERFRVVRCRNISCTVADISATCERWADGMCFLDSNSPEATIMLYFTYDSSVGVISFEFGPDATGLHPWRYLLVGERGILAPPAFSK